LVDFVSTFFQKPHTLGCSSGRGQIKQGFTYVNSSRTPSTSSRRAAEVVKLCLLGTLVTTKKVKMSRRHSPFKRRSSRLTPARAWEKCMDPPQLPRGTSMLLCGINVVLPGVGTMAAGAIKDKMDTFLMGALQLLTSVMILGWLWSVAWGVELVFRSIRRGASEGEDGIGGEGSDLDIGGLDADWLEARASGQAPSSISDIEQAGS
ncbi:unnamed protein product, partial [Scytosiphon promiscuus]